MLFRSRAGGFDALVPSPRQSSPRLPVEVIEMAVALKRENPARTAAQVRRILRAQMGWAPGERTLQRYFAELVNTDPLITGEPGARSVFGRFEAARPNELWTGDVLWRSRHNTSYGDSLVMPACVVDREDAGGRGRGGPSRSRHNRGCTVPVWR